MIELITKGMKGNVVAFSAWGKVTHDDYRRIVIPIIEEKVAVHPKIRFLYHLGEDLVGFSAEALWDDARVGFRHLAAFEKMAVVTDILWVKEMTRLFGMFMPCPVKIFPNADLRQGGLNKRMSPRAA